MHDRPRWLTILVLIGCTAGWQQSARGAKIVYPWRATTAIVKAGETVEVWFDADTGQTVHAAELTGPYTTVQTSVRVENGSWVYDEWSGNSYDRKITLTVPPDAPADRYGLVLKTSTGDETSLASVKVIKEYKSSYYVMHISDAHRWQGGYDTPNVILPEISTVIDIANIIDPEMLFETGDGYYPNANSDRRTRDRIVEYLNGTETVNGINDAYAAYFSVPGNHCSPSKNYKLEPDLATPARYWNEHFGLQMHTFTYGDTRFVGVNNAWCPPTGGGDAGYVPNYKWQLDAATNWISEVGAGKVRVAYCHVPQESIPPLYNALKGAGAPFSLMMAGHIHRVDSNPFSIERQAIVYSTDTPRDGNGLAPFNLYRVNDDAGTCEAIGNTRAAQEGLETKMDYTTSKLKRTFSGANNGTRMANTATIVNKFDFPVYGARIRFVMPLGETYSISAGEITQAFDGDSVHVVDVRIDLLPNSTTSVGISAGVH